MSDAVIQINDRGENVAIQINIDDDQIDNLSESAKNELKKQAEKHVKDIIKEANLIEDVIREDGACQEITSNIIIQAVRKNKNSTNKKTSKWLLLFKILSAFSLLLTGFLFDSDGYQKNSLGFIFFVVFLIVATISTVMQFVLEEKE